MLARGRVLWFDSKRGFGYIREDGRSGKVFFHMNNLCVVIRGAHDKLTFGVSIVAAKQDAINLPIVGESVVFEKVPGKKGFQANPWGFRPGWDVTDRWSSH